MEISERPIDNYYVIYDAYCGEGKNLAGRILNVDLYYLVSESQYNDGNMIFRDNKGKIIKMSDARTCTFRTMR